jgi:transposase-like protein
MEPLYILTGFLVIRHSLFRLGFIFRHYGGDVLPKMNLPKTGQANKVVYQKPKEKKRGQRKRYTGEEKVKILREVWEDGKAVSQVAESGGVHPNLTLNWRKQMSGGALKTFETSRPDIAAKAADRKAQALEEKLREKDGVIVCLAREVLALKKIPVA